MAIKKIDEFDKKTCRELVKAVEAAMQTTLKKHGVKVIVRNGSYTDLSLTQKFEFLVDTEPGKSPVEMKSKNLLDKNGAEHGLYTKHIGTVFMFNNKFYKFIGMSDRGWKYPLVGLSLKNNQTYRFPIVAKDRILKNYKK